MPKCIQPYDLLHLEHVDSKRSDTFRQIIQLLKRGRTQVDVLSGPITSGIKGGDNEVNFNATIRAANNLGYSSTSTQIVRFGVEPVRYWTTLSA